MEQRFDPTRYLRTPTSVRRLIGPDPRIVSDDNWAKLVWAGLNLTEPDLPCTEHGRFLYPFQMLRAPTMVWLFSGLYGRDPCFLVRSRESRRRVGRSGAELPER
jgi:hypothetical protein